VNVVAFSEAIENEAVTVGVRHLNGVNTHYHKRNQRTSGGDCVSPVGFQSIVLPCLFIWQCKGILELIGK